MADAAAAPEAPPSDVHQPCSTTASGSSDGAGTATRSTNAAPSSSGTGIQDGVRERFKFLCAEDQKTVCRRECELALSREEALVRQIRQTIDSYSKALEVGHAINASLCTEGDGADSPGLSPELAAKYADRIDILTRTLTTLTAEPVVTLPQLSVLDKAKGFAFASYANTALAVNKFKENTVRNQSGPQESRVGSLLDAGVIGGARATFGSTFGALASRLGGRDDGNIDSGYPQASQASEPPEAPAERAVILGPLPP